MQLRIGPNEPCWCGSGLKFKKCHYNRAEKAPAVLSESHEQFKKAVALKRCLHWDAGAACSGGAIKAHAVQRNGNLSLIARNGEVYVFDESLPRVVKEKRIGVSLKGIATAGTFHGFCAKHDARTFEPLENSTFASTPQQVALLGYRAVCKELLGKIINKQLVPTLRNADRGKSFDHQLRHQEQVDAYDAALCAGMDDVLSEKVQLEQAIQGNDYSNIHYCCLITDRLPPLAFCYAWLIECDFSGHGLQSDVLRDPNARPDALWVATASTPVGGAMVFGWLKGAQSAVRFIDSLTELPVDQLPDACVRFAIEFIPDCCIAPDWWEQLPQCTKDEFLRRRTQACHPFEEREPSCLVDDGVRTGAFSVLNIVRSNC